MSGRDDLKLIFKSIPYRGWALTHPVDARKVALEFQGSRRPSPSSAYARGLVGLCRRFSNVPGEATRPTSLFSHLGTLLAQAGSFPVDGESARAFRAAGGKWIAVQFYDPVTDGLNRWEIAHGYGARWSALGVTVLGWHRVEHFPGPANASPAPLLDGWVFNSETSEENDALVTQTTLYRSKFPSQPLAVATLGKQLLFPTGILAQLKMDLLPECFTEEGTADDSVAGSTTFWERSGVPRAKIHPMILFKDGVQRMPTIHAEAAEILGLRGMSSFVGENTPPAAWQVMA